jgi:hypothetical protein
MRLGCDMVNIVVLCIQWAGYKLECSCAHMRGHMRGIHGPFGGGDE